MTTAVCTPEYARLMATYNAWVNREMYAICAAIPESDLRRPFPIFYRSVFGTLNHLLYGDRAWLGRFTGVPYPFGPADELYSDFATLRREREQTDQALLAWAEGLTSCWLDAPFTYVSKVDAVERTLAAGALVIHLFNHQTHHRGQVTTLLALMGHAYPTTDLPWLPSLLAASDLPEKQEEIGGSSE